MITSHVSAVQLQGDRLGPLQIVLLSDSARQLQLAMKYRQDTCHQSKIIPWITKVIVFLPKQCPTSILLP